MRYEERRYEVNKGRTEGIKLFKRGSRREEKRPEGIKLWRTISF
jgi:hypothetical protein